AAPIAEERVVPGELVHTPPIHEHLRTIPPLSIKNLVSDSFHVVRRFKAVADAVPLEADVRCNQAAPPAVARETVGRAVARPFSCHQHHVESLATLPRAVCARRLIAHCSYQRAFYRPISPSTLARH